LFFSEASWLSVGLIELDRIQHYWNLPMFDLENQLLE